MILSLSWKNIWRNKTRSLVVVIAMLLGIFGGVMAAGIMNGWIEQRIHDSIHNEVSHIQIHNPGYMYNEEIQYTIKDFEKTLSILDTTYGVSAYSPRIKQFVMAKIAGASSGFMLVGADHEKEVRVSEIHKHMIEGEFLGGEPGRHPSIVIGSKIAENLKLLNYQVTAEKIDSIEKEVYPQELIKKLNDIGSKRYRTEKQFQQRLNEILSPEEYSGYAASLTDYFSFYRMRANLEITLQDEDGNISYPVFRLRGIYKTNNQAFDGMYAFVDRNELGGYLGFGDGEVHEIAILTADNETALDVSERLSSFLPESEVLSWRKLSPDIALYTDFSNVIAYVYIVIILFALAFGIINTMMMSVLERFKELGMLMAIGMNRQKVFRMIMLESVFLSLTGAITGMVFSGIILALLGKTGINFGMWGEGLESIGYASIVYPVVTIENYIWITVLVIITGIISSIWPARRALRLNPVEALRTE